MFNKQRKVSEKLGKNNTTNREKYYNHIKSLYGSTNKCNFGHVCGSTSGVKHEGPKYLPITDFDLKGCSIGENGEVIIKSGNGLQTQCRNCSSKRRKWRSETNREYNKDKGFEVYEKEHGKTKNCSICKMEKNVRESFNLSLTMKCSIHNVCIDCTKKYGDSMGDRLIKYRPDGNFKYKKTEKGQHDDHIMPLKYGGTNEAVNHQLLPAKENLSKSSKIPYETVHEIPLEQMCERWKPILQKAKKENIEMVIFESRISLAIEEEQKIIYYMTDEEKEGVFKKYNKNNNRRIKTKRAVEKFKTYCKNILKF